MRDYDPKCKGCKLVRGELPGRAAGFIPLGTYWTVNHYEGGENFPGWLAMQPRKHRMTLSELEPEELQEFWIQFQRLETALRRAWPQLRPCDEIHRVYLALLFESGLEKDEEGEYWHIHFHVVPRTRRIGEERPTCREKKLCITNHKEWYIIRQRTYRPRSEQEFKEEVKRLMAMLEEELASL